LKFRNQQINNENENEDIDYKSRFNFQANVTRFITNNIIKSYYFDSKFNE